MTTPFTTREEIEHLFSTTAVDLRVDDAANPTEEDDIIDENIDDATEYLNQYVWMNYREADLVASNWVRRRATYVAAHFLSSRRGNPGQYIDRFQSITEELKAICSREMFIPGLNVLVQSGVPSLANYTIDNRGLGPVNRVLADSYGTYPGQRTAANYNLPEII